MHDGRGQTGGARNVVFPKIRVRAETGFFQEVVLHQFDVIVLGAGIVGVSTAFNLRQRGLDVALVDRQHPGEETSFGNAGIIERNGFCPIPIPNNPSVILDIVLKQSTAVNYNLVNMIRLVPWLRRYYRHSGPQSVQKYARVMASLRGLAVAEHQSLASKTNAERFYRKNGWLHLYRSRKSFMSDETERHYARIYGADYVELAGHDINSIEPGLRTEGYSAVYWPESESVSSPGGVTDAIWRSFIHGGGRFFNGNALLLDRRRNDWMLRTERADIAAKQVVVALGPWSADLTRKWGDPFPLAVKRGYHQHFRPASGASLSRPVVDMDHGFVLTPMERGIRLTTGVEFADRDAPPSPVQVDRARKRAGEIFALGNPVEETPWMGCRPCLPDSLPVIGASTRQPGLWYNFGHAHAGFTLGPVTGRLLAEMMTGSSTCVDPGPLSPLRFSKW